MKNYFNSSNIFAVLLVALMIYEGKAQCENFPIGVSATKFNCDFENGELCLHMSVDLLDPLDECLDCVIEVEFEEGAFIYTDLGQGIGEFELVSQQGDPVILRSSELPLDSGVISSVCMEGLVQTPGMSVEYRVINPGTNHIVSSGTIQPDQETVIGSPNTNTLLSSVVSSLDLLPAFLAANQAQSVVIEGTLIVDMDYVFGSSLFSQSGAYNNIRMGGEAEIIVKSGNTLTMLYSDVYSCGEWNGITVEEGAIFNMVSSEILDAEITTSTNPTPARNQKRIDIYPNPVSNSLNLIYSSVDKPKSLILLNTDGQKVMEIPLTRGSNQMSVDVSSMPPGVYWIMDPQGTLETIKMVKM